MARAPRSKTSPKPELDVVPPDHMIIPPAPPHVQPAPIDLEHTPPAVGEQLRRERERRGITIEAVAQMLKIRRVYLRAIEESNWAELPEPVYVNGFIRSYANFLGLNLQQPPAPPKSEIINLPALPKLEIPKPIDDHQLPSASTIIMVVVGLFFLYAVWAAIHSDSSKPAPQTQAATDQSSDASAPAPTLLNEPALVQSDDGPATPAVVQPRPTAPSTTTYGAMAATRATITATQDSWIEIQTPKKEVVFSGVLRVGDSYHVPTDAPLLLSTTNLPGLKFELDGTAAMPPVDAQNTVEQPLSLSPASFLKVAAATPPAPAQPTSTPRKHDYSPRAYAPPPRVIKPAPEGDAEDSTSDQYPDDQ